MNRCLDEWQTESSLGQTNEQPGWTITLVCLLLVWAVFSLATLVLLVAVLLPGHLGWSDLLQALGQLLPADPSHFYGT